MIHRRRTVFGLLVLSGWLLGPLGCQPSVSEPLASVASPPPVVQASTGEVPAPVRDAQADSIAMRVYDADRKSVV